jgi:hypothetical protein
MPIAPCSKPNPGTHNAEPLNPQTDIPLQKIGYLIIYILFQISKKSKNPAINVMESSIKGPVCPFGKSLKSVNEVSCRLAGAQVQHPAAEP